VKPGDTEPLALRGVAVGVRRPFDGLRGGNDRTRLLVLPPALKCCFSPLCGLFCRSSNDGSSAALNIMFGLPRNSDGDSSRASDWLALARCDDASVSSRSEVRSESIFLSRYETKVGGTSPTELPVLLLCDAVEMLCIVDDDRDDLEDAVRDLSVFRGRVADCGSAKVKNRSAGRLAPSRNGTGLPSNGTYPKLVLAVDVDWTLVRSLSLGCTDGARCLDRNRAILLVSMTSRSVCDIADSRPVLPVVPVA